MIQLLLIGLGSAIGGMSRYLLSNSVYNLISKDFPYGTLSVNMLGSFFIGVISTILMDRFEGLAVPLRALLIIGFLGGFTTFSSFSMETLNLLEGGEIFRAILNVVLSLVLCLLLTGMGVLLARQL
jgi:CrcB protein